MPTARSRDEVMIARLRMRGIDAGARTRLAEALSEADWPQPVGDEWVFVRSIDVRASASALPARVVTAARETLACSADEGRVVRFASEADMVAALLADLVDGRAGERWVWRRWASLTTRPTGEAVGWLLREHLVQLAELSVRLARRGRLAAVWHALGRADAIDLGERLATRFRYRLPAADEGGVESADARPVAPFWPDPASLLTGAARSRELGVRWRGVLQSLDAGDPRRRLALQLIAGEIAPMALIRAPGETLRRLSACFQSVCAPVRPHDAFRGAAEPPAPAGLFGDAPGADAGPGVMEAEGERADGRDRHGVEPRVIPPGTLPAPVMGDGSHDGSDDGRAPAGALDEPGVAPPRRLNGHRPGVAWRDDLPDVGTPAGSSGVASSSFPGAGEPDSLAGADTGLGADLSAPPPRRLEPAATRRIVVGPAAPAGSSPNRFATAQAGLFRLLNLLNRPQVQALMCEHWAALPNGWAWLYRLGQTLALAEGDPMVDFLAEQIGLDDPASLANLPPLPAGETLLGLAVAWYGRDDLWQPALLALDARVTYTASHVDIHAALDTVRLDVRLAGLDLDPGWLPWLGRVVRFYFE